MCVTEQTQPHVQFVSISVCNGRCFQCQLTKRNQSKNTYSLMCCLFLKICRLDNRSLFCCGIFRILAISRVYLQFSYFFLEPFTQLRFSDGLMLAAYLLSAEASLSLLLLFFVLVVGHQGSDVKDWISGIYCEFEARKEEMPLLSISNSLHQQQRR